MHQLYENMQGPIGRADKSEARTIKAPSDVRALCHLTSEDIKNKEVEGASQSSGAV